VAAESGGPRQRLFVVSANDEVAATKSISQLITFVEEHPEVFEKRLARDVAYTLCQRRSHLPWRIGVAASSLSDLAQSLSTGHVKPSRASSLSPRVAFVYTGQGAQWHAMGRELCQSHPVFAHTLRAADACLAELGANFSLVDELAKDAETSGVGQAHISQPACTAVQLALTNLLASWGVRPAAVTGHSSGEIAAAYAAGALSLKTAMAVSYFRGQAVVRLRETHPDLRGAMLAVGSSADVIARALKGIQTGTAVIACENSPGSFTVSGDESAVDELAPRLESMQFFHRKLRVDVAYHSPHMELAADEYRAFIKDAKPAAAAARGTVRFYSSLHGREVQDLTTLDASYWVANLVSPVRFSTALGELCSAEEGQAPDVIVEVGPHAALEGPIKQTLQSISHIQPPPRYLPTLVRNQDATQTMLNLAASMYTAGHQQLHFAAINGEDASQPTPPKLLTNMQPYPWSRQRYWAESRLSEQHRRKPFPRHDLLGLLADWSNNDICPTWRNVLRLDDVPWLRDHQMMGLTTFPLAGYLSMAVEAAAQRAALRHGHGGRDTAAAAAAAAEGFALREVQAMRPLLLSDGVGYEVVTSMASYAEGTRSYSDEWDEFRICSWEKSKGWTEHCRGLIRVVAGGRNPRPGPGRATTTAKLCGEPEHGIALDSFYQELQQNGVTYGSAFRGLRDIRVREDHAVAALDVADLTTSTMPSAHQSPYLVHPTMLDHVVQLVFPILGAGYGRMKTLYMPSAVRELYIATAGVARHVGQPLYLSCDGRLGPDRPESTHFTIHAFSSPHDHGEAEAPLLSIVDLRMSPVRNKAAGSDMPRELCFRLDWEPISTCEQQSDDDGVCSQGVGVNGTLALANGANGLSTNHHQSASNGSGVNGHGVNGHHEGDDGSSLIPTAVSIVTERRAEDALVDALSSALVERTGQPPRLMALSDVEEAEDRAYIVLEELDRALLPDLTADELTKVQALLLRSAATLWVTAGAYRSCTNPAANMASGLLRTVRSETAAKAATLDLDPDSTLSDKARADLILEVFERLFRAADGGSEHDVAQEDMEYAEEAGRLIVPRIVADDAVNEYLHRELHPSGPSLQPLADQSSRLLRLDIATAGALDTLYFDDAPHNPEDDHPLGDHEVEIRVAATGVNFKDVVIAMGQLPHPGYLGVECAGVVSRVGKAVSHLAYGDRVCAMSEGAYSTVARCPGTSAAQIPDAMAFEDAASIPVVYGTAYYGLVELARLTAGESVLIHAAAGGVGQAAIQLAKMVGADVFATVGSPEKKKLIMERYGVPEHRIFSSRETSFGPAVREATGGVGVDVVLNSLAGDFLRETWECVAAFGRFIEIGKRDITSNTRLEMAKFDRNVTFSSVDLTLVAAKRPAVMARTLNAVMTLVTAGVLRPVAPVTVFGLGEVEKAFRLLQSGKTMGKLVVVPNPGSDVIRVTSSKVHAPLFRANGTYMIVGGTGGLGRSIARWMVAQGARYLVLASRSARMEGAVADLSRDLQEQETEKVTIAVKACDVADADSVRRLMTQCGEELPPVRGCIHATMVLRDVLFEKMTHPEYSDVIRSKVHGAWNLHTELASTALDFFIVLSSVAGMVGNRGQAAYAAANTSLDALARHRRRLGLPGTSLALSAVQDVGYLAEDKGARRLDAVAQNLGAGSFLREAEVLALVKAAVQGKLDGGGGHCLTGVGLAGNNELELPYFAADAKFRRLRDAVVAASADAHVSGAGGPGMPVSIEKSLARASGPKEAMNVVVAALAAKLATVLMIPPESIDPLRPITTYGLDSLNAIEWRNWITKTLKENLQVLELLSAGSLQNLAALILKRKAAARSAA
jgi:acyl transferase domain-containing protein